ncbi:MAG: PfkB family carbohydrate kinase, partial [Candidatus Fimimonas sp.]
MKEIFVLGSINYDMVVCTDHFPVSGETTNGYGFLGNSGGKGANQAVAISKFGGNGHLIGRVGNDTFGEVCLSSLKNFGVDTAFVEKAQCNTGVAVVNDDNGNAGVALRLCGKSAVQHRRCRYHHSQRRQPHHFGSRRKLLLASGRSYRRFAQKFA